MHHYRDEVQLIVQGNRVEEIYPKPNLSHFSIVLVGVLTLQLSFDEQDSKKNKHLI